ncbi:MAG: hypothetical protein ABFR53_03555 [Actinomycetota bacterium]
MRRADIRKRVGAREGEGDYADLLGNGFGAFPFFNGGLEPIGVWDVYEGVLH